MDEQLQYVDLGAAEVPVSRSEAGEGSNAVLYVDGVVQGPAGDYVTIIQNGQTYAIPTSDYAAMLNQPEMATNIEEKTELDITKPNDTEPKKVPVPSAPSLQPVPVFTSTESVSKPVSLPPVLPKPAKQEAGASDGPSMNWMTKPTPQEKTKKKIFTSKDSSRKYLYPTIQEVIKKLPEQDSPSKKNYKPIRVDNWGIFLLSRLQNYFQKKEFCDMTLRFPSKNAQIKVHKLIINACTDYFCQLEKEGKMTDGAIDMPANFTPETLAPIIRFMYTGKIELKEATYKKLYETADTLQMGVLTKLMDAQVNAPEGDLPPDKKSVKRSSGAFEEDPIEQMRKIRRIEKRVALEGKKSLRQSELDGPRLPGKKLPIWKRKTTDPIVSLPSEGLEGYKIPKNVSKSEAESLLTEHIEASREEDDESTRHIKLELEPLSGQLLPSPVVGATYKKRNPGEKQKIPRKLQEIQQHLMFEKVLKSGTKNTVMKKEVKTEPSKDLSIEEVKELMQEQKQRTEALTNEDQEDDDEFDYNDNTIDMDDDYIDNIDSPAPLPVSENINDLHTEETEQKSVSAPAVLAEPEPHKKTIRFSHKPSSLFPEMNHSNASQNLHNSQAINGKSSAVPPVAAIKSKPVLEFSPVDPASQRKLKLVPVSQVGVGMVGLKSKGSIVTNLQQQVGPPDNNVTNFQSQQVRPPNTVNNLQSQQVRPLNSVTNLQPDNNVTNLHQQQVKHADSVTNLQPQQVRPPDNNVINLQQQEVKPADSVINLQQQQLRPPDNVQTVRNELDEALEEFSRVAEEEAEELAPDDDLDALAGSAKATSQDPKKPRRGRPPRWLKEQTLQMGAQARNKGRTGDQQQSVERISEEPVSNQAQVINEVLKKHPNLLRDNKAVKVKIMTKDAATGKSVTKFITLKAQQNDSTSEPGRTSSPLPGGFKPLQKVMYTGKRGRPKKVKPGDYDPHQEERKKIEERLKRDYPHLANQLSSSKGMEEESENEEEAGEEEVLGQLDTSPNPEAESLSTVTNGLAASISLPPGAQPDGSSMMGQYQPGQALVMENGQIHILTQGSPLVNVDTAQSQPGDFIQILTADGQVQQFALAKNKMQPQALSQAIQPQPFSFLPTETSETSAAPTINIQTIGDLHNVGPGIMSLAPAPLIYNTNSNTPSLQPQQVYQQSVSTDNTRAVNKIVSDWDSDEECQE